MEVNVERDGHTVPSFVSEKRDKLYQASFTPIVEGRYKVEVNYNGAQIRGELCLKPFSPN